MPVSRSRRGLLFVWAALVIAAVLPPAARRIAGLAGALASGWPAFRPTGLGAAAAEHATLLAAAVLPAIALLMSGGPVARWISRSALPGRGAAHFLLGAGAVGTLSLGLAAARLFYPGLLALAFAIPAAAGRRGRAAPAVPAGGGGWRLVALFSAALLVPWMLVPESHPDGWEYFLAGPERWLSAHSFSVLGATPPVHYPAVAEMLYALPVWAGADAAPKWLNAFALWAGALALAEAVSAGWAGLALLATAATTALLATSGKNEGFCAGFVMLAVAAGLRGAVVGSAMAGGLALSTRYLALLNVGWVPLCCFLPLGSRGLRRVGQWAALAAAVAVPWYAKSWLLTGDPAYPVLSGLFPSLQSGWDARNAEVWRLCTGGTGLRPGAGMAFVRGLLREHAGLVVVLPLILAAAGPRRRIAVWSLAAFAGWYALVVPAQLPRWGFPAIAPLLVAAGPALAGIAGSGIPGRLVAAAAICAGLAGALGGRAADPNPLPCATGFETREGYRARILTTSAEARGWLKAHPSPGALLLCGETRELGLPKPCRLAGAHASGETPLPWRLSAESRTAGEMAKRLRELGVARILANPVLGMTNAPLFAPFEWNDRQLRVYADFVGRWWDLELAPARSDALNGCTYLYSLRRTPRPAPTSPLLQLPGTESRLTAAVRRAQEGRRRSADQELAGWAARLPRVLQVEDTRAWLAFSAGDFEAAWRLARPGVEANRLDDENLKIYAGASYLTGRWPQAASAYGRVRTAYPGWEEVADRFAAQARFQQAIHALGAGRAAEAEEAAAAGLAVTTLSAEGAWRPRVEGLLLAVRALARLGLGRTTEAKADLAEGTRRLPGLAGLSSPGALSAFLTARAREMRASR